MTKLLRILYSTMLCSTVVVTGVVSCSKKNSIDNNSQSDEQKQIIDSAKIMSQLILSGRHENLNYNLNEVLTDFLAPNHNWSGLTPNYDYIDDNGHKSRIDFSQELNFYKNRLNPLMSTYDHGVVGQASVYASYIMGMYNPKFYQNALKKHYFNDSMSRVGTNGLFDVKNFDKNIDTNPELDPNKFTYRNSKGVLNGLENIEDLNLNGDSDSRNLAWGIQDTGPLTNYLLNKGYDGSPANIFSNNDGYINYGNSIKAWGWDNGSNSAGYGNAISNLDYTDKVDDKHSMADFITKDGKFALDKNHNLIQANAKTFSELNKIKMNKVTNGELELLKGDANKEGEVNVGDLLDSKIHVKSTNKDITFNGVGTSIVQTSGLQYINGQIGKVPQLFNSISPTDFGSTMMFKWMDNIYPAIEIPNLDNKSEVAIRNIVSGLSFGSLEVTYDNSGKMRDNLVKAAKELGVDTTPFSNIKSYNEKLGTVFDLVGKSENYDSLFSSPEDREDSFKNTANFFDQIVTKLKSNASDDKKNAFIETFLSNINSGLLGSDTIMGLINWAMTDKTIVKLNLNKSLIDFLKEKTNGQYNLTNILQYSANIFRSINKHDKDIKELINTAKNTDGYGYLSNLSSQQVNSLKKHYGYVGGNYKKGTLLGDTYDLFSEKDTHDTFSSLINLLTSSSTSGMHDLHKNVFSHIFGNEWSISNSKANVTSTSDITGKLSFTLDYNGVGDKSSNADTQYNKVDVPDKFNPYQTKADYFKDKDLYGDFNGYFDFSKSYAKIDNERAKLSGTVLGKDKLTSDKSQIDNALINYDGTGNISDLTKKVHHRYKIEWKNVGLENNPYWVISKIDCFNVDNKGNEKQFYNIY